ncbi:hypothetical protein D3C75_515820 [compost metagenome]
MLPVSVIPTSAMNVYHHWHGCLRQDLGYGNRSINRPRSSIPNPHIFIQLNAFRNHKRLRFSRCRDWHRCLCGWYSRNRLSFEGDTIDVHIRAHQFPHTDPDLDIRVVVSSAAQVLDFELVRLTVLLFQRSWGQLKFLQRCPIYPSVT